MFVFWSLLMSPLSLRLLSRSVVGTTTAASRNKQCFCG
ncbi:hypothetical protein M758_9G060400 [Ceratodon purpureus]|nr:hypothetical protein M758_9G060400 [Ceratodon purpureus]